MRELRPAHEEHWFEIYGRIALTGDTEIRSRPGLSVLHKPVAPELLKKTLAELCRRV